MDKAARRKPRWACGCAAPQHNKESAPMILSDGPRARRAASGREELAPPRMAPGRVPPHTRPMNQTPRAPQLTPAGRYPVEPEGLRLADPESPDFLGSYTPRPPYPARPDLAERYQPGSVTIACSCGCACRRLPTHRLPDPNRGWLRKLTDALLLRVFGYDRYVEPWFRKQGD
jgi:hypothetical protein